MQLGEKVIVGAGKRRVRQTHSSRSREGGSSLKRKQMNGSEGMEERRISRTMLSSFWAFSDYRILRREKKSPALHACKLY